MLNVAVSRRGTDGDLKSELSRHCALANVIETLSKIRRPVTLAACTSGSALRCSVGQWKIVFDSSTTACQSNLLNVRYLTNRVLTAVHCCAIKDRAACNGNCCIVG
jgi:hypothetical protein